MAYDVSKLAKLAALKTLAEKVKSDYATKTEVKTVSDSAAAAFKSGKVDGNTVSLFTSEDKSGNAAFTFDFPTEMFLDQTKTEFVAKFKWAEATYPGSTDPKLEGKPGHGPRRQGREPRKRNVQFSEHGRSRRYLHGED